MYEQILIKFYCIWIWSSLFSKVVRICFRASVIGTILFLAQCNYICTSSWCGHLQRLLIQTCYQQASHDLPLDCWTLSLQVHFAHSNVLCFQPSLQHDKKCGRIKKFDTYISNNMIIHIASIFSIFLKEEADDEMYSFWSISTSCILCCILCVQTLQAPSAMTNFIQVDWCWTTHHWKQYSQHHCINSFRIICVETVEHCTRETWMWNTVLVMHST